MNRQKWVISDTQASYVSMAGLYASCVMLSGLPNDQTKFMADNPAPPPLRMSSFSSQTLILQEECSCINESLKI